MRRLRAVVLVALVVYSLLSLVFVGGPGPTHPLQNVTSVATP
jgi:hypothetical protein